MLRIQKVMPDDNCTREFLCTFSFIVEYLDENGCVNYAKPFKSMDELWHAMGRDVFIVK